MLHADAQVPGQDTCDIEIERRGIGADRGLHARAGGCGLAINVSRGCHLLLKIENTGLACSTPRALITFASLDDVALEREQGAVPVMATGRRWQEQIAWEAYGNN